MRAFDLFADVPRLELVPPAPQAAVYEGRDAVHGWFAAFADRLKNLPTITSRHVISNLRMILREDGSVAASHVLTLYRDGLEGRRVTDPVVVTDADEVFVRERGVWKIASRILTPVFGRG
jgi:SnoaL-like domain